MNFILASQSRGRKALLSLLNLPFEVIPSTLDEDAIIGKTPLQTIKLRAKLKGEEVTNRIIQLTNNPIKTNKPRSNRGKPINNETIEQFNHETTIISADSGASLDNQLIGKPKDYDEAVRILTTLSGKRHEFITAVYLLQITVNSQQSTEKRTARQDKIFADRILSTREKSCIDGRSGIYRVRVAEQENFICKRSVKQFVAKSFVTFKKLTVDDIRTYLSMTKYTRYAGAYALFICPKCPRPGLADLLSKQKYHQLLEKTCTHVHIPNLIERIEGSLSNVIGLPLEKLIPFLITPPTTQA